MGPDAMVNPTFNRRSMLATTAAAVSGSVLFGGQAAADDEPSSKEELATGKDTIPPLEFYFPNALLNADGEPLTDDSMVAVTAEPTADFTDAKARWKGGEYDKGYREDGAWTPYPDDVDLPLVAVDDSSREGTVVGVGSLMAQDGTQWDSGNPQFVLNLWDRFVREPADDDATVLFHEYDNYGNKNTNRTAEGGFNSLYWRLDKFSQFREYAEGHGYEVVSDQQDTPGLAYDYSALAAKVATETPEAVWLPVPDRLTEEELSVLDDYVSRGGVLFLHDCSGPVVEEFDRSNGYAGGRVDETPEVETHEDEVRENPEEAIYYDDGRVGTNAASTDLQVNKNRKYEGERDPSNNLNEILEYLGIEFRFNDGLVRDDEYSVGSGTGFDQISVTARFNTDTFPRLFADRSGIEPNDEFYHFKGRAGYVADGDTYDLLLNTGGTVEEGNQFEVRCLGIDAPEDGAAYFERPVEWEGVADGPDSIPLVETLQFEDACTLLNADGDRLRDHALVPVPAADTAKNVTTDGGVDYGDAPLPLVAAGDRTVGVGSLLVDDGADTPERRKSVPTYEFLQNVWDDYLGGGKTVLYDEGHGQAAALDDFSGYVDVTSGNTADYTIEATENLLADLSDADAVWLTPHEEPFTDDELDALAAFVDRGGTVFVHGRAGDAAATTDHLDRVAEAVGAPFRFNTDEVRDEESNGGAPTKPRTSQFGDRSQHPYFLLRQSDAQYETDISDVYKSPYLLKRASEATSFARDEIGGVTVELDPRAPIFEGLGRLLVHTYPGNYPDGKTYEERILEEGLARAYDSGHARHDEYLQVELDARVNNRGIWEQADPANSEMVRNRDVEHLYLPQAASVRTESGRLGKGQAPVLAEPTASQEGDPEVVYRGNQEIPLVGLDEANNVALVGSPLVAESYEIREDDYRNLSFVTDVDPFQVNTAGYENFTFLANLLRYLTDEEDGSVLIDGGHFQFGGSVDRWGGNYAFSAEDSRYFERFLEGIGINCEGINDLPANLTGDDLVEARAIVISTPRTPFTDAELAALSEFEDKGGAVVLIGSGEAPAEEIELLNDVAAALGTRLRLNDDRVLDPEHNLKGEARLPTTGNFSPAFNNPRRGDRLFGKAPPEPWSGPGNGLPADALNPDAPDVVASGTRTTDANEVISGGQNKVSAARPGQRIEVQVTLSEVNTTPVRLKDTFDDYGQQWNVVLNEGDAQGVTIDNTYGTTNKTVDLGVVRAADMDGDGPVTRTYYVEAPDPDYLNEKAQEEVCQRIRNNPTKQTGIEDGILLELPKACATAKNCGVVTNVREKVYLVPDPSGVSGDALCETPDPGDGLPTSGD